MKTYTITATADQMNLLTKFLDTLALDYDRESKRNANDQDAVDRCEKKIEQICQLAADLGLFTEDGAPKKF